MATTDADGPARLRVPLGAPTTYDGVGAIFFRRQWSEAFKYSRPLASWLKAHVADFDLVHIHAVFSHACLAAARASYQLGQPYVVSPHGTLDPWSMRQKPVRKWLMWHLGARRMLACAAAVHYTTRDEERLAEASLGLSRGVVVPLGLDLTNYAGPATPGHFRTQFGLGQQPYVLVLSRLHPKKRLGPLIDAFLEVTRRASLRQWRLVIAGDGDPTYKAQLLKKVGAASHADEGRVIFAGWLGGTDKLNALYGASLMALPSLQENFGISVVESLACGVPVLLSTQVNLAEDVVNADAGWVVALDHTSLTSGLAEAMGNLDELTRRGRAGRQLVVDRFSWPAVATQLVDLYSTIVTSDTPANR